MLAACSSRLLLRRQVSVASVRYVSVAAARALLGLGEAYSPTQLRAAYFDAARSSHPDAVSEEDAENARRFIAFTEAYEKLRGQAGDEETITASDEEDFRARCLADLGLTAEVVEEVRRRAPRECGRTSTICARRPSAATCFEYGSRRKPTPRATGGGSSTRMAVSRRASRPRRWWALAMEAHPEESAPLERRKCFEKFRNV